MLWVEVFTGIYVNGKEFRGPVIPCIDMHAGLFPVRVGAPPVVGIIVAHRRRHLGHVKNFGDFLTVSGHVFRQEDVVQCALDNKALPTNVWG